MDGASGWLGFSNRADSSCLLFTELGRLEFLGCCMGIPKRRSLLVCGNDWRAIYPSWHLRFERLIRNNNFFKIELFLLRSKAPLFLNALINNNHSFSLAASLIFLLSCFIESSSWSLFFVPVHTNFPFENSKKVAVGSTNL